MCLILSLDFNREYKEENFFPILNSLLLFNTTFDIANSTTVKIIFKHYSTLRKFCTYLNDLEIFLYNHLIASLPMDESKYA